MHNFFLFFVLAHLLGDFVFQTDKIAQLKAEGVKGVALHSVVITVAQVALMAVFGSSGIYAALLCGLLHFFIDCLKLTANRHIRWQTPYFIFDQLVHFGLLWGLTLAFFSKDISGTNGLLYVKTGISLILATYVSSVFSKILVRDLFAGLRSEPFFKSYERVLDMFFGISIFVAFLLPFPALIIILIISIILYFVLHIRSFQYPMLVAFSKLFIISVFAYISSIIMNI
ncbi:MAG: DUF3307 domain-containing protein [Clostridia bacterium]|nr:DUF3307 domain-containing protein [Clostridia bacterium]